MLHTTDQDRAGPGGSTKRPGLTYDPEVSMNYDSKVGTSTVLYCTVLYFILYRWTSTLPGISGLPGAGAPGI